MSCIMSERLEALSRRLVADENNCGRALALLEDRIKDIEAVGESVAERLCRLESRNEHRLRDTAVLYRCNACDPGDGLPPCGCVLSQNLGVPEGCIYGAERKASWKRVDFDLDLGELILESLVPGVQK